MIVSYYSPTYASEKTDITTFYNGLSSLVRHIPKNNVLVGNLNAQTDKNENKFGQIELANN